MAVNLSPLAGVGAQFLDNNGNVLTGGKLYSYAAGTTTPQTTYTNAAGTVANSNPIILNASGRVPTGEIWLTDGIVYKFVLTDANDVTIATYDNITGINSNFVNFTNKQEIQTATAGQTVFTLTTMDYQPGTNSLTVFVDGVNQYGPGASYSYVETDSTTVTFNAGLHVGAEVKFTTSQLNSTAGNDAFLVSYVPPFTGSQGTNVGAKLSETVSVKDFGAVGDGVADDTAAIRAALEYAFPLAIPVEFEGSYLVSGFLLQYTIYPVGSLHIVCKGNVNITVDAGATAFDHLLYGGATAANNGSITGGSLKIDCNNRVGSAITFRHGALSNSGVVNVDCPVTILNCKNNDASDINANAGFAVLGDYKTVVLNNVTVNGVSRTNVSGGSCQGIVCFGSAGTVVLNNPVVSNVLTSTSIDADGISLFGKKVGAGTYASYLGSVTVNEPIISDCQVRSIKIACSNATIFRPKIFRQYVVSTSGSIDIDFQTGGQMMLIEPYFEYKKNGGVSPLAANFYPLAFQCRNSDEESFGKCIGGHLVSEIGGISRFCFTNTTNDSKEATVLIDGLILSPIGGLATSIINNGFLEFNAGQVELKSNINTYIVRNCQGPVLYHALTYNGGTGASLANKCRVECVNNTNTISTGYQSILNISGSSITVFDSFSLRDNNGFRDAFTNAIAFNFATVPVGNKFSFIIGTGVPTNAPALVGTWAFVEVLGRHTANKNQCRITVDNATVANTVFYTGDGGTTWGTIK